MSTHTEKQVESVRESLAIILDVEKQNYLIKKSPSLTRIYSTILVPSSWSF